MPYSSVNQPCFDNGALKDDDSMSDVNEKEKLEITETRKCGINSLGIASFILFRLDFSGFILSGNRNS